MSETDMEAKKSAGKACITRVGAVSKDSLDIEFDNGNILLLNVDLILKLPGFGHLAEDDRIYYPKTSGDGIYWRDGPHPLAVDEIIDLVSKEICIQPESAKSRGNTSI